MARNSERDSTERLFDRVSAGGDRGAISAAGVGMARDVLGRRAARAAGAIYKDQGAGVGGLEAAPRSEHGRSVAYCRARMETIRVSRRTDDVHDVSVARHAGFVSRLSTGSTQGLGGRAREYRNALQRRRGF